MKINNHRLALDQNANTLSPSRLTHLLKTIGTYDMRILEDIIYNISENIFKSSISSGKWVKCLNSLMLKYNKIPNNNKIIKALSISNFASICDRNGIKQIDGKAIYIDKYFSIAEELLNELNDCPEPQFIEATIKVLANRALHLRNNEQLNESYEKYIKLQATAEASEGLYKTLGKYYAFIGIGDIFDRKGKYREALKQYNEAEELLSAIDINNIESLTAFLNEKQGNELQHLGYYNEAEGKYLKSLMIRKSEFKEDNRSIANIMNSLGYLYKEMGRFYDECEKPYSGAFSCLGKALEIRKRIFHQHHPFIATTLKHLGDTYCEVGKYKQAIQTYNKALLIRQKSKALRASIYMASLLNSLAAAYLLDNNLEEAAEKFREASKIFNSINNFNYISNQKFYTEFLKILQAKLNR